MQIAIVTGEPSGDALVAPLVAALQAQYPELKCFGVTGDKLAALGVESLAHQSVIQAHGLIEPIGKLPTILRVRRQLIEAIVARQPTLVITVDFQEFNLSLAKVIKAKGIPVVQLIGPTVWAWRANRVHKVAKAVDGLLSIFPMESAYYDKTPLQVDYIGHPLAETIDKQLSKSEAKRALGLADDLPILGILPGSRQKEIHRLLPVYCEAIKHYAQIAKDSLPGTAMLPVIAPHNDKMAEVITTYCVSVGLTVGKDVVVKPQCARELMHAADFVWVTSGTASLETALVNVPMVISYKTDALTFAIGKRLIKSQHIGLPNILANERYCPELVQDEMTPVNLVDTMLSLLNDSSKLAYIRQRNEEIFDKLLANTTEKALTACQRFIMCPTRSSQESTRSAEGH